MHRHAQTPDISRRTFLTTTGAALVGAALGAGLVPQSEAVQRHPRLNGHQPAVPIERDEVCVLVKGNLQILRTADRRDVGVLEGVDAARAGAVGREAGRRQTFGAHARRGARLMPRNSPAPAGIAF